MMTFIITFFVIVFCFGLLTFCRWLWALKRSSKADLLTKNENPTLFDVKELIKAGEDDLAVIVYIRIFRCGVKEAQRSVQDLKRNINNISES